MLSGWERWRGDYAGGAVGGTVRKWGINSLGQSIMNEAFMETPAGLRRPGEVNMNVDILALYKKEIMRGLLI